MQPGIELEKKITWISVTYKELVEFNKTFTDFFKSKVQKFISSANLLGLTGLTSDLQNFTSCLNSLEFIEALSEQYLYHTYFQGFLVAGELPFTSNFSQDLKDAFYRLKILAIQN